MEDHEVHKLAEEIVRKFKLMMDGLGLNQEDRLVLLTAFAEGFRNSLLANGAAGNAEISLDEDLNFNFDATEDADGDSIIRIMNEEMEKMSDPERMVRIIEQIEQEKKEREGN